MSDENQCAAEGDGALTDEQIDLIAADGMRNAAGGIYETSVYAFARACVAAATQGLQARIRSLSREAWEWSKALEAQLKPAATQTTPDWQDIAHQLQTQVQEQAMEIDALRDAASNVQPKAAEGDAVEAIYAAWHGAGVDIAGGDWKRFVSMLPPLFAQPQPHPNAAALRGILEQHELSTEAQDAIRAALANAQPKDIEPSRAKQVAEIMLLVGQYWDAAYVEGKEGRSHDTEDGRAQVTLTAIYDALKRLAATQAPAPAPATGDTNGRRDGLRPAVHGRVPVGDYTPGALADLLFASRDVMSLNAYLDLTMDQLVQLTQAVLTAVPSPAVGAEPREVRHTIKKAGAVVCNGAVTRYESPSCIVLEMDLQSKYCELDASCGHGVFLAATERSLHLDDSRPRDDMTWVEFELPAGKWSFVSGSVSRYTLTCVFLRDADSNVPVQGTQ